MELYRQYVDPDFRWENFSLEEQATILKAQRCNAILDVGKVSVSSKRIRSFCFLASEGVSFHALCERIDCQIRL